MNASTASQLTSGTTDAYIRIVSSSGTGQISFNFAMTGSTMIGRPLEAAYISDYHALVPKRTMEEEEAEEREWDTIIGKPHVKNALRRMVYEARRQYYAGETEEGGFGLE